MAHDRVTAAVILAVGMVVGGCNRGRIVDSPLANTTPAARAADSFVHCVEGGRSGCVAPGELHGGWDALHLLLWLASGSPVAILEMLPRQLDAHTDPLRVQTAFVQEVERYAAVVRGAECQSVATRPLPAIIDHAAELASKRLQRLGLWRRDMQTVITGLAEEAHQDLDDGHMVRLDCTYDPYRLYVVTRPREDEIRIVGMTTMLAPALGGDELDSRSVQARLDGSTFGLAGAQAPIQQNTIDAWLRFPVEDL